MEGGEVTDMIFSTRDGRDFQELGRLPEPTRGHCVVALGQVGSRSGRFNTKQEQDSRLFVNGGYDQRGTAKFGAYMSTMNRAGLIDRE